MKYVYRTQQRNDAVQNPGAIIYILSTCTKYFSVPVFSIFRAVVIGLALYTSDFIKLKFLEF